MNTRSKFFRQQITFFCLLAMAAITSLPSLAQASTSAGATIWNKVTVNYTASGVPTSNTAVATVTVLTLATAPTITVNPISQITLAGGGAIVYTYTVISNANGPDTYTVAIDGATSTNTDVSAQGNALSTGSIALWGGIVTGSGAGYVELPGGFNQTNLADGDKITLIVGGTPRYYTVTAASTVAGSVNGATGAETKGKVFLTPVGGTDPAITDLNVGLGAVISEYNNALTNTLTAGALTAAPADGTHTTNLTFTTTATDLTPAVVTYTTTAGNGNETTTTVKDQILTITKVADLASAKPGETITYTITVTNVSTNAATGASIIDTVPTYTTYVTNSTRLNTKTVAGDGATSPLAGGLIIDDVPGRAAGAVAAGTIQGSGVATITYQVTVD